MSHYKYDEKTDSFVLQVKELSEENEQLKIENEILKNEIEELNDKIWALEADLSYYN